MLVVLTTDAVVPAADLDAALRAATRVSFDRLDSDGCMSTNDTVTLMASGASGITPDAGDFTAALTEVCTDLAMQLLRPTPRAPTTTSRSRSLHAASEDDAVEVGRSVARNNLFKAAIFGNDPNWGRVLAGIGTTQRRVRPRRPRRRDERRVGVPRGRPRPRTRRRVDLTGARGERDHRPQGRRRRAPRSGPTTSPTTTSTRTAPTRS